MACRSPWRSSARTTSLKVYDQGDDAGVNAANLRRLDRRRRPASTTTTDAREATIIQTRHRVPEDELGEGQMLVLQVPVPEPLRGVERRMRELRRMHAEADYARMWVSLYEDKVRNGVITRTTGYPCLVGGRYVIATTPIPRWDVPKLHRAGFLAAVRRRAGEADLRRPARTPTSSR